MLEEYRALLSSVGPRIAQVIDLLYETTRLQPWGQPVEGKGGNLSVFSEVNLVAGWHDVPVQPEAWLHISAPVLLQLPWCSSMDHHAVED